MLFNLQNMSYRDSIFEFNFLFPTLICPVLLWIIIHKQIRHLELWLCPGQCDILKINLLLENNMCHFSYACKTERENGISRLISTLCVNCLSCIPEYSRIIDYSIIWLCIWCGLLQKLHKIKKSELLNSKVSFKL